MRRVLALDAGSRCIKLLLAESDFGRLRILKEELVDLQAEGLVAAEELQTHLQTTLEEWGRPPLALILPQHASISQVIDLPLVPESEVARLIQDETVKLSGVSESRIVYDFVRTDTAAQGRQQFWVTWAKEGDIRDRIARLGVEQEDLCEVTTTANALIAAYRLANPQSSRAILVHLGAQTTVLVILLAGQGVFATSFQMGGDFFTRSLARLRSCPEETAETQKRTQDVLNGPDACSDFAGVVDGWVAELKRQLNEWFEHNAELAPDAAAFELIACGGGFSQPGLLGYLKARAGMDLQPWPQSAQSETAQPSKQFEVAFGAALQALGYSTQPVSLLPEDYRLAWRKRQSRQRLEVASLGLVVLCLLAFAFGTWRQASIIDQKRALLGKLQSAREAVEANNALTAELYRDYESFRPMFACQQNTLDTLKTLTLLQQTRSNRSFWYVLFADQQSYFNQPAGLSLTNTLSATNVFAAITGRGKSPGGTTLERSVPAGTSTNLSPAKPGFIAELCIPDDGDEARRVRRELVDELKQQRLFSKVDLLSDDLRRNLAESKVVISDRNIVLALDFAATGFQQPLPPRKPPTSLPARAVSGRAPQNGDNPYPSVP